MSEIVRPATDDGDPTTDVLLVSMPFGILVTPSLALGLLQASLRGLPVRSRQRYFSFDYCRFLSFVDYQAIANRWGSGHEEIGEWVFAEALSPEADLDAAGYLEHILRRPPAHRRRFFGGVPEDMVGTALRARSYVESFLDDCMREVETMNPRIVAFTSMFQQRVASLALARRIKEALPDAFIAMGGADCEEVRGKTIVRQFPFVDAAVSGPGDVVFPELVTRALERRPIIGMRGVYSQADRASMEAAETPNAAGPANLDDLPYPQFDDYFRDLDAAGLEFPVLYLSLETSRGCWWGEKHHCTFCSINGASMAYLSKSGPRVIEEVKHFAGRHPGTPIVMTDSILNIRHLDDAIPTLAASGLDLDMMYEVRPTLTVEQFHTLRACGVKTLQPGIESLSSEVLMLMRKRSSYLHNLRLLKLGRTFEVEILWNLLIGFPDEPPDAYAEMARLIPLVTHLQAPKAVRIVEIGRHSPLFEDAVSFGVTELEPSSAYRHIYPMDGAAIRDLATYFTYTYRNHQDLDTYALPLTEEVRRWWQAEKESTLRVSVEADRSLVFEGRHGFGIKTIVLEGVEHHVHRACEDIVGVEALAGKLAGVAAVYEIETALVSLERRGLVVRDGKRWLSLTVREPNGAEKRATTSASRTRMRNTPWLDAPVPVTLHR